MKKKLAVLISFFLLTSLLHSQDDNWVLSGQIQLRSELDGRDFSNKSHPLTFASLRTRVGVQKSFMGKVNFFVQLQDSRVFGEEGNTLTSINNIDLHQGYIKLNKLFNWNLDIQAGRFEAAYGTERFLGAVGWHYIGRAWDGVRVMCNPGFKLDIFALTHTESVPYISAANPQIYSSVNNRASYSVYGFWAAKEINLQHRIDVFAFYEINRSRINNNSAIDHTTFGFNYSGKINNLYLISEAAYQTGSLVGSNLNAYLLSLYGNYQINSANLGVGADIISGTKQSSDEVNTFASRFGTNHKFYGYMDYFINFSGQYLILGLNDYYIKAGFNLSSDFGLSLNLHHFTTNKEAYFIPSEKNDSISYNIYGQEIDLILKYEFIKGTTISWGSSLFIPDELMKIIFSTSSERKNDIGFWSYLMVTANL